MTHVITHTHQNKIKNEKYAFDLESFLCACLLKQSSRSAHSCASLTVKHIVGCPSRRCTDVSFPATCITPQPQDAVAFKSSSSAFLFHHGEQPPPSASLAITTNPLFTKTLLLLFFLFLNPFLHDDALVAATASSRRISLSGAPIIDTTC